MTRDFIFGTTAGLIEICVLYPLDLLKTYRHSFPNQSVQHTFRTLYSSHGWKGFYRGFLPPLLIEPTRRGLKFGLQQFYFSFIPNHLIVGVLSGMTEAIFVNPFELMKIRMQLQPDTSYVRTLHSIGLSNFWKGYTALALRSSLWNSAFFSTVSFLQINTQNPDFLNGGIAGIISTLTNNPIDVVKTRIQQTTNRKTIYHTARDIFRHEGVFVFYKGCGIKCFRQSLGGGITISIYSLMKEWMPLEGRH